MSLQERQACFNDFAAWHAAWATPERQAVIQARVRQIVYGQLTIDAKAECLV
jgi:hypothetical protein